MVRHAHAVGVTSFTADAERPLSVRGRAEAASMAENAATLISHPALILASTALRAADTARAIRDILPRAELVLSPDLYGADPTTWIQKLQALPQDVETALIVGHNPGLELLVEELAGAAAGLSPATLAHLEIPVDNWRDLQADGTARQVNILHPEV